MLHAKRYQVRNIKKILIANRGEIVLRIIRSCKQMGIKTAAIYTTNDRNKIIAHSADEYIKIEGENLVSTHLNIKKIIKVAKKSRCDALHPGYGFLAENPELAEACEDAGILFIGPSSKALNRVADKLAAQDLARESGLETIGSSTRLYTADDARKFGSDNGYPLVLKSCKGGGGKGIRIVYKEENIQTLFEASLNEATATFNCKDLFAEKHIRGRHIEIQFMADKHGKAVHLSDRECSIQRRHQKLIEEAPSPLSRKIKEEFGKKVCELALRAGYAGVGTVEFLLDESGKLYFLEINPRIQVEHGITEMITGVDLVMEQIRIAQGSPISIRQTDINLNGHAIECRIIAENTRDNFSPSRGIVAHAALSSKPEKEISGQYRLRIDTAIYSGIKVNPQYDSLLAKVMVWSKDRRSAIKAMSDALTHLKIEGIINNISFCKTVIDHPDMKKGRLSTDFIREKGIIDAHIKKTLAPEMIAIIATAIYEKEYKHKLLDQEIDNWTRRAIEEGTINLTR